MLINKLLMIICNINIIQQIINKQKDHNIHYHNKVIKIYKIVVKLIVEN